MSYNLTGAAYGGNVTLTNPALATGTTNTYTLTAFTYTNKGIFQTQFAAKANVALPALDAATGKAFVPLQPGESCLFGFFADTAQALNVVQSKKAATLDLSGGLAAIEFPQMKDNLTPFGYILVKSDPVAATVPWTFGTTNWATTGVTQVAASLIDYPAQPIIG